VTLPAQDRAEFESLLKQALPSIRRKIRRPDSLRSSSSARARLLDHADTMFTK
jgi:hypothetical protein